MCGCKNNQCFITLSPVASAPTINLPENMRLRNNRVISMQIRRLGGVAATNVTGATLAPDTVIMSAYLTLKTQNGTAITDPIPLQMLMRDYNSPDPMPVSYEQIDPVQSTITLNTAAAGYAVTQVIEITFGIECDCIGVSPQ